ncbi:MAG: hypothetical protein RL693_274 [Verrucomicrobiota bacterium]|jgi:hypothetical protein
MKKIVLLNLAFWLVAIAFPIIARSLPTGSGLPPKIDELLIPVIQIMLALGSTYLVGMAVKPEE